MLGYGLNVRVPEAKVLAQDNRDEASYSRFGLGTQPSVR
jgi:hypothetical protein